MGEDDGTEGNYTGRLLKPPNSTNPLLTQTTYSSYQKIRQRVPLPPNVAPLLLPLRTVVDAVVAVGSPKAVDEGGEVRGHTALACGHTVRMSGDK